MQNPVQKFRQSSIVFEEPGIFSEKLKFFNNFCSNFIHVPCLPMSTKGCVGFSLFCLELEFFAKIRKCLVSTDSQKPGLSITQDLKKIIKSHTSFLDIIK